MCDNLLFKELFPDFPFKCILHPRFQNSLVYLKGGTYGDILITGYCDGDIINREEYAFIKVSYDKSTHALLNNEINILKHLQKYDFVPILYDVRT